MEKYLLSCDWGTSSLRVLLLDRTEGGLIAQVNTDEGNANLYRNWLDAGEPERIQFYQDVLKKSIDGLGKKTGKDLAGTPLFISGMASSTLGMKELPYQRLPLSLKSPELVHEKVPQTEGFPFPTWLFSGIKSDDNVMRGEEAQLLGVYQELGDNLHVGTFIFPGTHSKHLEIKSRKMVNFDTFMTGEVFQLLAKNSILQDSLEQVEDKDFAKYEKAFQAGVQKGAMTQLLAALFLVRTNQLLQKLDKKENFYFLSGLLIGSELKSFLNKTEPIILCAGSRLTGYYASALKCLGLGSRLTEISGEIMDMAVAKAHLQLGETILGQN